MFDIDFKKLKLVIIDAIGKKYIKILESKLLKINSDKSLSAEQKEIKIYELYLSSTPALIAEISGKLIEENNKVIWNKLVELGIVKD